MKLFNKLFNKKSKTADKAIEPEEKHDKSEDQSKTKNLYFSYTHEPTPSPDTTFIYCLVGNIVDARYNEKEKRTYTGTKHFSPGTKVYCYPPLWGDGFEKIKVIGKRRLSHRMITVIISSKQVTNWRVKAVYKPFIIKQMSQNAHLYNTESHKEDMLSLAASLNER